MFHFTSMLFYVDYYIDHLIFKYIVNIFIFSLNFYVKFDYLHFVYDKDNVQNSERAFLFDF